MSAGLLKSGLRRLLLEARWKLAGESHWIEAAKQHQWVFVMGCNRSGKTTLSNLFRNHPEASVIPNANVHTRAVPESAREGCPHIWVEKLDRFRLVETDSQTPAARLIFDWLHYYPSTRRVVFLESDIPAVQMRWLQLVFPNSAFVGVVRNGYAVAEGLRMKEGYAIDRCARQWKIATEVMLEDARLIRNFQLVSYEEFTSDPVSTAERLCGFLGISVEPLRPFLRDGWRLGNNDPHTSQLRNDNETLIRRLTSEEMKVIDRESSELMENLGYHSRSGPAR